MKRTIESKTCRAADGVKIVYSVSGAGESGLDRKKWGIPEFDAAIMKHMGHYPMLERPDEFNRRVAEVVAGLMK